MILCPGWLARALREAKSTLLVRRFESEQPFLASRVALILGVCLISSNQRVSEQHAPNSILGRPWALTPARIISSRKVFVSQALVSVVL